MQRDWKKMYLMIAIKIYKMKRMYSTSELS